MFSKAFAAPGAGVSCRHPPAKFTGTPATLPILETHALQGQSPYSASKIAADKLCEAYYRSFGVPVVTLRPFNTYGPRQSTRAVLPTIIVQLLAEKTEIAPGRLDPRRDLTFVSDTVEGFIKAGEAEGVEGEEIHLGTGRTVSVGELFEIACSALASRHRWSRTPRVSVRMPVRFWFCFLIQKPGPASLGLPR